MYYTISEFFKILQKEFELLHILNENDYIEVS